MSLKELNLSKRALNCLENRHYPYRNTTINTVGELTKLTDKELLRRKNLGGTVLKEIKLKLLGFGLCLSSNTYQLLACPHCKEKIKVVIIKDYQN